MSVTITGRGPASLIEPAAALPLPLSGWHCHFKPPPSSRVVAKGLIFELFRVVDHRSRNDSLWQLSNHGAIHNEE